MDKKDFDLASLISTVTRNMDTQQLSQFEKILVAEIPKVIVSAAVLVSVKNDVSKGCIKPKANSAPFTAKTPKNGEL
jgi:hypothetical protein